MTIGEALKQTRKNLAISQQQMAAGVVSLAQYSRIENDLQEINTVDLIKILTLQGVDVQKFIKEIQSNYDLNNENKKMNRPALERDLIKSFYAHDGKRAVEINEQIQKLDGFEDLKLRSTLVTAVLNNKVKELSADIKIKISRTLINTDNWTHDKVSLQLFGNSMVIYDFNRLTLFMDQIINTYLPNTDSYSYEVQGRIAGICVNYLHICCANGALQLGRDCFTYIENLHAIPEFMTYKMLSEYYKDLYLNKIDEAKEIKNVLKNCGYEGILQNLPKLHI